MENTSQYRLSSNSCGRLLMVLSYLKNSLNTALAVTLVVFIITILVMMLSVSIPP